nr:NAC transcription factor 29-like [Quercus suber]
MALLNNMKDSSSSSKPEPDFLPIGYRFSPSPAQFVKLFLCNWILSRQLPLNHIKYIKYLFQLDADQVPKGQSKYICEDEAFYFTEINPNEMLSIRTTKNGYWKTNGEEEEVIHGDNIVGFKTIWNFFWGRAPNGEISHWRIEEYRLHPSVIPADELSNSMMEKIGRCVACKIKNVEKEEEAYRFSMMETQTESDETLESSESDYDENIGGN